jgi:hypothetical protein
MDQFSMQLPNGRPPYSYSDYELRKVARDAYVSWQASRYSVPWPIFSVLVSTLGFSFATAPAIKWLGRFPGGSVLTCRHDGPTGHPVHAEILRHPGAGLESR